MQVIVENLRSGLRTLVGTPTIRSSSSSARSCSSRSGCGTSSCCPSPCGSSGDRVPVRAPGSTHLRRLRRRLVLHGALLPAPARAVVARRGDGGHGRRRGPLRTRDRDLVRHPPRHRVGVLRRGLGHRPVRPAAAEHPWDMRGRSSRPSMSSETSSSSPAWRPQASPTSSTSGCSSSWRRPSSSWRPSSPPSPWPEPVHLASHGGSAAWLEAGPEVMATRSATVSDFDRLVGRLTAFGRLSPEQRTSFLSAAVVREDPLGLASSSTVTPPPRPTSSSTSDDGRHPGRRRVPGLSTMAAGDYFGEIAALTGSLRTADVMADVDSACWRYRAGPCEPRCPCRRSSGWSSPR